VKFEPFSKVHRKNAAFSLKEKFPMHEALFRKGLSISKFVVLCSVYKVHISDLHDSTVLFPTLLKILSSGWAIAFQNNDHINENKD